MAHGRKIARDRSYGGTTTDSLYVSLAAPTLTLLELYGAVFARRSEPITIDYDRAIDLVGRRLPSAECSTCDACGARLPR